MNREDVDTRDNQSIFNYFWQKFIVESVPRCTKENGNGCQYAPTPGTGQIGCAIGCLLDPEDAIQWDNELPLFTTIKDIYSSHPDKYNKYFDYTQLEFLKNLQVLHDSGLVYKEDPSMYRHYQNLLNIVLRYNVTISEGVIE